MNEKINMAETVADKFLNQIDSYDFKGAYDLTSNQVKAVISCEDWEKKLNAFRKPLGKCISRQLKSSSSATSIEGLPDALYFTFIYTCTFAAKAKSEETIIIASGDQDFKVMGYTLK